jgi:hypothetical protein
MMADGRGAQWLPLQNCKTLLAVYNASASVFVFPEGCWLT